MSKYLHLNGGAPSGKLAEVVASFGAASAEVPLSSAGSLSSSGEYDEIVAPSVPSDASVLQAILRALKPSGKLRVFGFVASGFDTKSVESSLLLAGFVEPKATIVDGSSLEVTAQKPNWESGASFSLASRKVQAGAGVKLAAAKVAISSNDDDLIDEDSLLSADDFSARPKAAAASDDAGCAPTRKACKNCSCGRAEAEASGAAPAEPAVKITADALDGMEMPKSSCGSCALGDAFRCAGCPFKGMPKFTAGSDGKIKVLADDDA